MRIVENAPIKSQPNGGLAQTGNSRVTLQFISLGTAGGRSFRCPNGTNYVFDGAERNIQVLRKADADYLLSRWPQFFKVL